MRSCAKKVVPLTSLITTLTRRPPSETITSLRRSWVMGRWCCEPSMPMLIAVLSTEPIRMGSFAEGAVRLWGLRITIEETVPSPTTTDDISKRTSDILLLPGLVAQRVLRPNVFRNGIADWRRRGRAILRRRTLHMEYPDCRQLFQDSR